MPLVVNCSCGKRLQVRDELAGKKFRCPACQAVLEAPSVDQSGTAVLVASPEAPPVPPPPPKKPRTMAVPAQPVIAAVVQPVVAAVAQPAGADEESEDEGAPKKKKKKKKKPAKSSSGGANWSLIAGLGGGLVVVAALVVAGIFVLPKLLAEAELDAMAAFQGDPEAFVTVDTEKLFSTNEGMQMQQFFTNLPKPPDEDPFKLLDINPTDLKRISVVFPNLNAQNQMLIVINSNKKMSRSRVDANMGSTKEDLNGRPIYRTKRTNEFLYMFPGDKTLAISFDKNVLDAVTRLKGGSPPATLPSAFQEAFDSDKHFFAHFKMTEAMQAMMPPPNPLSAPFLPMAKFQWARVSGNIGPRIPLSFAFDYGEQSKAAAAIQSYNSLPLAMRTAQAMMGASDPKQKEAFNQFVKLINDSKPTQDGKKVNLKIELPQELVTQMAEGARAGAMQQANMNAQGGMGGPPGGFGGGPPNGFGGGPPGGGMQGTKFGGPSGGRPGTGPGGMQGAGKSNRPISPGLNSKGGNPNFPAGAIGGPSLSTGGAGASGATGASAGGGGAGGGGMANIRNGSPGAAVMASRGAGDRAFNQNQLRAIGRAMQMYADSEGGLPAAAICDASGKPLLSWRVAILPYLEQDNLYKQFHLNEPWDSPHNKALLPMMPKFFSPRNQSGESVTPYRAFANGGALELNRKNQITSFADGTSQTFLVVETFDTVEWTQPEALDPNRIPALGSGGKGQFSAVLGDGSVRSFPSSMPASDLKAWATRAGGESIAP